MTTLRCPGCRSVVTDDICPKCTTDSDFGPFYGECIYVLERGPRASQECSKPFMRWVGDGLVCQRHADIEDKREQQKEQERQGRQWADLFLANAYRARKRS